MTHDDALGGYEDGYHDGGEPDWSTRWLQLLDDRRSIILGDRAGYLIAYWHGLNVRREIERAS